MSQANQNSMQAGQWALLFSLALFWAGTVVGNAVALQSLGTFSVVACRVGLGAAIMLALVLCLGHPLPRRPGPWAAYLLMGLLNNMIPFSLMVWAQNSISAGLTAVLNSTTPLFTVFLAHFLTRDEKLTPAKLMGIVLGVGGVAVLVLPGAQRGGGSLWACLAVLAAACSYALAGIFGKRLSGNSPLVNAAGQLMASALLMIPLALWLERPWELPAPSAQSLAALAYIGLFGTAGAYIIYFRLLATAGATNLLLVTLLIPPGAMLLETVLLGRQPAPGQLAGMALIAAALLVIDGRAVGLAKLLARPASGGIK